VGSSELLQRAKFPEAVAPLFLEKVTGAVASYHHFTFFGVTWTTRRSKMCKLFSILQMVFW